MYHRILLVLVLASAVMSRKLRISWIHPRENTPSLVESVLEEIDLQDDRANVTGGSHDLQHENNTHPGDKTDEHRSESNHTSPSVQIGRQDNYSSGYSKDDPSPANTSRRLNIFLGGNKDKYKYSTPTRNPTYSIRRLINDNKFNSPSYYSYVRRQVDDYNKYDPPHYSARLLDDYDNEINRQPPSIVHFRNQPDNGRTKFDPPFIYSERRRSHHRDGTRNKYEQVRFAFPYGDSPYIYRKSNTNANTNFNGNVLDDVAEYI